MTEPTGTGVIPAWLLADANLSTNAKLVYLALSTYIDKRGECWPSHAALAERCASSPASVKRGLDELRERRIVTWKARRRNDVGQTSNRYRVRLN